jgi:hypothetical protein
MNRMTGLLVAALLLTAFNAKAAIVAATNVTITSLYTYPQYGGGDVVIQISQPVAGCGGGFWLSGSDPGMKTVYAQLLAARLTRATLAIWAFNDQIWTGSGTPTCRIQAVGDLST